MLNYTKCAPVQIYDEPGGRQSFPYALVIVLLTFSLGLYALSKRLFGGKAYAMQSKAATTFATIPVRGSRGCW
ncbi:MAG: hypothetical protein U1F77_16560 [Kiritimatiellia bacterium]